MKAYLTRRYRFPAAHTLRRDDSSEAENRQIYGKCSNPHGHGHNYALEVTVSGPVHPDTGMVCDLLEFDNYVSKNVLDRFDHANLNVLPEFAGKVPTTENLCAEIYARMQGFKPATIERVRLEETKKNSFAMGNLLP